VVVHAELQEAAEDFVEEIEVVPEVVSVVEDEEDLVVGEVGLKV